MPSGDVSKSPSWHFLTNHSHVLLSISEDPDVTVRELARRIGITERAVIRIIGENPGDQFAHTIGILLEHVRRTVVAHVEAQLCLARVLVEPVAGEAVLGEDRADVAIEADGRLCSSGTDEHCGKKCRKENRSWAVNHRKYWVAKADFAKPSFP